LAVAKIDVAGGICEIRAVNRNCRLTAVLQRRIVRAGETQSGIVVHDGHQLRNRRSNLAGERRIREINREVQVSFNQAVVINSNGDVIRDHPVGKRQHTVGADIIKPGLGGAIRSGVV